MSVPRETHDSGAVVFKGGPTVMGMLLQIPGRMLSPSMREEAEQYRAAVNEAFDLWLEMLDVEDLSFEVPRTPTEQEFASLPVVDLHRLL